MIKKLATTHKLIIKVCFKGGILGYVVFIFFIYNSFGNTGLI